MGENIPVAEVHVVVFGISGVRLLIGEAWAVVISVQVMTTGPGGLRVPGPGQLGVPGPAGLGVPGPEFLVMIITCQTSRLAKDKNN